MSEQNQEWEVGDIIEESYPHWTDRVIHYLLMEQNPTDKYVFTALDLTYGQVINYSFQPDHAGLVSYRRLA